MQSSKKQIIFSFLTIILVVFFLELALTFLSMASPKIGRILASPWIPIPAEIPDRRLGHRLNPIDPEHDRNGFRNPSVPRVADIVALGDSQTYGEGVEPSEAWPRQLESISGRKVYSMAVGGYGPAHSLILWDEAMALRPKIVIEALYAGNDLYDSFHLVYYGNQFPGLKTVDQAMRDKIELQEKSETIDHRVEQIFTQVFDGNDANAHEKSMQKPPLLIRIFSERSKLYGLMRRVFYEMGQHADAPVHEKPDNAQWENAKKFAAAKSQYCQLFDDGQFRTIFLPEYRLAAMDRQDARIQEGQQILLKAVEKLNELGAERGIRFLVVLLPTKELVFRDLVHDPSTSYSVLIASEERFWNETTDFLKDHKIEYVDALPVLREQFRTGNQPYQVSEDGHPNKIGHKAIAELINAQLKIVSVN